MIGVIHPCLARAVLLARDGHAVIYIVPSREAAQETQHIVGALDDDVLAAEADGDVLNVGAGTLKILRAASTLLLSMHGQVGMAVLHAGLRWTEWRCAAFALNWRRYGLALAELADVGATPMDRTSCVTATGGR